MEKEEWIDKVMNSAGQLEPAEPDPFLFTRLSARLDKAPELPVRLSVQRLAVAFTIMLVLNLGCLLVKQRLVRQQAEESALSTLGRQMGFNKNMNY